MAQVYGDPKLYTRGVKFTNSPNTTGIVLLGGTNTDPITTAVANKNFIDFRTKSTATSGDSRGVYLRHYIAGAGAAGEAARFFTTVDGITAAVGGSVHGAHIGSSLAATGNISGQMAACRVTLGATAATRTVGGAQCALLVESDVGTGNTMPTYTSYIRVVKTGSVDLANLFDIQPSTCTRKGSAPSATDGIRILLDGSPVYLMVGT